MKLAAANNEVSYKSMLKKMDSDELANWKAFYQIYPMPGERDDYNAGLIRHAIYDTTCKSPPKIDECIPNYDPKPKPKQMSGDAIKAGLRRMFSKLPIIRKPRPKTDGSD